MLYQTETSIYKILILTVFPLSGIKTLHQVWLRVLPVEKFLLRGFPALLLSMLTNLHAICILYHLWWTNHFHITRSLLLARENFQTQPAFAQISESSWTLKIADLCKDCDFLSFNVLCKMASPLDDPIQGSLCLCNTVAFLPPYHFLCFFSLPSEICNH